MKALTNEYRIFLVEDNDFFQEYITTYLHSREKFSVQTFSTGEEMLPHLDKQPDVILLDLFLDSTEPQAKSGAEILKLIRDKHPGIPVIMQSASEDLKQVIELLKNGASDYVLKDGFVLSNLDRALTQVMEVSELKNQINELRSNSMKSVKRLAYIGGIMALLFGLYMIVL